MMRSTTIKVAVELVGRACDALIDPSVFPVRGKPLDFALEGATTLP